MDRTLDGFDEVLPAPANRLEAPRGPLATFHELLQHPVRLAARVLDGQRVLPQVAWLCLGAVLLLAAYGASVGFFGGGWLLLVAALKVPLIVFSSLLLCLPSLYVFGSLSGARFTRDRFLLCLAAFGGLLALILMGFLPISWLFSVSSRSLGAVAFTNLVVWVVAVALAGALLRRFLLAYGARDAAVLWIFLFVLVSFQVTTYLRPVVDWAPGDPLFVQTKMWFVEHFVRTLGSRAPVL